MTDEGNITDAEVQLAVARVKLPEPDTTHYHTHPGSSVKYWSDDQIVSYAQACVRAASRVRPAGEPVAIKPLVWKTTSYGRPEATSVVGTYRIVEAFNGGWAVVFGGLHGRALKAMDGRENFATIDEAKAAGQAHFDAAIRSALTPGSPL